MKTVKFVTVSMLVVATALATSMASAEEFGRGLDRRGSGSLADGRGGRHNLAGREVIRLSQTLVNQVSRLERVLSREATSYRPIEREAVRQAGQMLRMAQRMERVAYRTDGQGLRLQRVFQNTRAEGRQLMIAIRQANFSFRVDRISQRVRDTMQQLKVAIDRSVGGGFNPGYPGSGRRGRG